MNNTLFFLWLKRKQGIRDTIGHAAYIVIILMLVFLPLRQQLRIAPYRTYYPQVHGLYADYYYYLSVIKQGRLRTTEVNQYTLESVKPDSIHVFYLLLGYLGSFTSLSDVALYHAALYGSLLLFYLSVTAIVRRFFSGWRKWMVLYLIFFVGPFFSEPLAVGDKLLGLGTEWWTRMDIYSRLTLVPHHFFTVSLMIWAVVLVLRFSKTLHSRYILMATGCLVLGIVFFAVPFAVFSAALLVSLCLFLFWNKNYIRNPALRRHLMPVFLLLCTSVVCFGVLFSNFRSVGITIADNFAIWEYHQYRTEQGPYTFWVLLRSYGILPILAVFAFPGIWKRKRFSELFIVTLALMPFALYVASVAGILPINKLRWVYAAPYVFGSIVAAWGLFALLNVFTQEYLRRVFGILMSIFLVGNTLMSLTSYWVPKLFEQYLYENLYIPPAEMAGIAYLRNKTPVFSAVLTSYATGVYLPAFTYNRVYVGHEVSTKMFWTKLDISKSFFGGTMPREKIIQLISQSGIEYVFWNIGTVPPEYLEVFEPVFSDGNVKILRVKSLP